MAAEPTNENTDDARVGYLIGDNLAAPLDPLDRGELDAILVALSHPAVWEQPSSDLGERIVNVIAADGGAARTSPVRVDQRGSTQRSRVSPAARQNVASARRQRLGWVGPAVLGAAAAGLIAVVVARSGDDEPATTVDATIDLIGTELAPGVSGTAAIDARQSGMWIRLDLPGLPRRDGDDFYEAWLGSEDGAGLVPIGTFHDGEAVVLWAGVAIEAYPVITVTRESVAGPQAPEQGTSDEVVATGQLPP